MEILPQNLIVLYSYRLLIFTIFNNIHLMIYSRFTSLSYFFRLPSIITIKSGCTFVSSSKNQNIRPIINSSLLHHRFCSQKQQKLHEEAKEDLSIKNLLQFFEKNRDNYNSQTRMKALGLLVKAANKRANSIQESEQISNCLGISFEKYLKLIENHDNLYQQAEIFSIVNILCLQNVKILLKKTEENTGTLEKVRNPKFVSILLSVFQKEGLKNKGQAMKFIGLYHQKNEQANKQLRILLRNVAHYKLKNVKEAIFFVKQLIGYYKQTEEGSISKIDESVSLQFLQGVIKYVGENIMLVDPKMLHIFTKFLLEIKSHERGKSLSIDLGVIEMGVEQHIKGLNIIESFNSIDVIYLLQVLENIVALSQAGRKTYDLDPIRKNVGKIYEMIHKIHGQPSSKQENSVLQQTAEGQDLQPGESQIVSEQKLTKKQELRLIDVNIIQESMLKLSVIDPQLFALLENMFFKLAIHSNMIDIQFYVIGRVRVTKTVIESLRSDPKQNTPEKLRLIKQEHIRFIKKLLETMNANKSLSLREKLKIIQICQKIPVKSRAIKKTITSMSLEQNVDPVEVGFADIIIAGF